MNEISKTMQNANRIGRFVPLMLLFILGACAYDFPEPRTLQQRPPGPPIVYEPDTGTLAENVEAGATAFFTQNDGNDLDVGIDFDVVNNQFEQGGIVGRAGELFQQPDARPGEVVRFTPLVSQSSIVLKGVDFNIVSLDGFSPTESLNDHNFAFMGIGVDGYQRRDNTGAIDGLVYRFSGYAGYHIDSDAPSVALVASATYNGILEVFAVSDNPTTEGLRNGDNRLNVRTDIVLTADFTAKTLTSPVTNFANDLGSVEVKGTFTGGETALGGTLDFILPNIFTRDNNAPISTDLQGVLNQGLAIGAFHGSDASAVIVGGFVARPQ